MLHNDSEVDCFEIYLDVQFAHEQAHPVPTMGWRRSTFFEFIESAGWRWLALLRNTKVQGVQKTA